MTLAQLYFANRPLVGPRGWRDVGPTYAN